MFSIVDSITEQATKLGVSTQLDVHCCPTLASILMFILSHFQSLGQEQVIEGGPANIWPISFSLYGSDSFYSKFAGHLSGTDFQSDRILPKLYSTWLVKWKNLLRKFTDKWPAISSTLQCGEDIDYCYTCTTSFKKRNTRYWSLQFSLGFFLGFGSYAWDWPQKQSQNILFSLEE